MDLKDNLFNALNNGECDKTPVVAFPSVLTTELLSKAHTTFDEACHDAVKMAEVAGSLYDTTGIEAITLPLDLWFEAESVGYVVKRQEGSLTPVVCGAPFDCPGDVELPSDFICSGQFPVIEKAAELVHESYDDLGVPLIGEITGAFTLLTDLVDLGTIIKMLNSDYMEVDDALEEINDKLVDEVKFYEDICVDCIVVNDPSSTSKIIRPNLFDDLVKPYLVELYDSMSVPGVLHICGDTNSNLENMFSCGYDGLSISQEVDISHICDIRDKIGCDSAVCGNISIGDLLMSNCDDIESSCFDCLDKGVDILGPSCNIAYGTPLNNIKAMVDARDKYFS